MAFKKHSSLRLPQGQYEIPGLRVFFRFIRVILGAAVMVVPCGAHADSHMVWKLKEGIRLAGNDQKNYYTKKNLVVMGSMLSTMGVMAHTRADKIISDFYQETLRSGRTDDMAAQVKLLGGRPYPICLIVAAASLRLLPDRAGELAFVNGVGSLGSRSLRIVLAGSFPMLLLQRVLGTGRPTQGSSHWKPFRYAAGMSGHAFMGAVPFLGVYTLSGNRWIRGGMLALSTMTGLSRVNDNKHYLSQVIGGWMHAFLAAKAVEQSERDCEVSIYCSPVSLGVNVQL